MPMALDQPLRVGSGGGHSDIRYEATAFAPGSRLEATFRRPLRTCWTAPRPPPSRPVTQTQ